MSQGILANAISSGQFVITAECRTPRGSDLSKFGADAAELAKMAHAVYVPESEDGVRASSLAACVQLAAAGVEPILALLTRDMNRIALQSSILGAVAMGVSNVMCLSGRHQALTTSGSARGVFDVDPIQLVRIADGMRQDNKLADGQSIDAPVELMIGTDTNPFSDPVELQVLALGKAVAAGADFVVTAQVCDLDRFSEWMGLVRERGLDKRTCIIASVTPADPVGEISKIEGVRGVHMMAGGDLALAAEVLKTSGLSRS